MRDYGGLATRHPWMVTMFVITVLAAAGLPMLNGFVGEFLILSGSMSSIVAHHIFWTVFAATGVIFGASYLLWMIQRVFYGSLGHRPEEVRGWDLTAREHLELWPFAALFLAMGICSPFWMRAIDTYGTAAASLQEIDYAADATLPADTTTQDRLALEHARTTYPGLDPELNGHSLPHRAHTGDLITILPLDSKPTQEAR
jgi:NADH-quinone oxidoreductase subunit M